MQRGGHGMALIYRKHILRRILAGLFLAIGVLAPVAMIGLIVLNNSGPLPAGKIGGVIVLAGVALVLLWLLVIEFTYKVTLTRDAITVSYPGSQRVLAHTDIAGRRQTRRRDGTVLILIPIDPQAKPLRLQTRLATDRTFESWFAGLRDLDAADFKTSEAAIVANQAYGATPQQRFERLTRTRTIMKVLNIAALAAAVWCLVFPWPYLAAIGVVAVLPMLALAMVATSRGLVRFARWSTDAYIGAAAIPVLCTIALAVRVNQDVHLIDWNVALYVGGGVGLALFAIAALADRRLIQGVFTLAIAAIIAVTYGILVLALADIHLDGSSGQDFRTQVVDSHIGRGRITSYFVKLASWGPWQSAGDVSVPETLFNRLKSDRMACVRLHDGAFGIRWFSVGACAGEALTAPGLFNRYDQVAPATNPFGPPPVACPPGQEANLAGFPPSLLCRAR